VREQILVIKHGALGDVVLATAAFAAIRTQHPTAEITLLTTDPYAALLKDSPYFDAFRVDARRPWWHLGEALRVLRFLRSRPWRRVYDLQTSRRSSFYYRLLPSPKPEFSGIARGCSHEHATPHRTRLHTLEREREQLSIAGITETPAPNIDWLKGEGAEAFGVHAPYALLVPGGSAHGPEKRWPAEHYAALAAWCVEQGVQPVLIGTAAEAEVLDRIQKSEIGNLKPELRNLCNRTSFGAIAELARGARFAVGNDTGPMHIVAAAGCPSVVLFSSASDPDLCAPRAPGVRVLREENLARLQPGRVQEEILVLPPKIG
jgi:ADP-heptose:LPS heptosyltransferase